MQATRPISILCAGVFALVGCVQSPSDAGRGGAGAQGAGVGEFGAEGVGYGAEGYETQIAAIDSIMMAPVRDGRIAGASVAVVHQGQDVAVRGYGWAELELRVPTPEGAVYEIGSVTKQFTSVGLLRLQEEGRVDLNAEIGQYLPDFPTQGNRITVRELLDHTSGIRGYTEMAAAYPYFVRRVPRDSLVALFAGHAFDFPTGEHEIYNNSAYYLAGMILEDVSGVSYEEYVEDRFFGELGMHRSHYCSETEIHEGKVKGYDAGEDGLYNKGFIVHNVPFSAGSLCSTAKDLAVWLGALHGGDVLSEDAYRQLIEPGDLNDGTRTRYALGLATSDILGHRALHHGGGINGFLAESLYLPDEELAVVVLVNTTGLPGPSALAREIVTAMVGDRTPAPEPFEGELAWYEGTYGGPARGGEAVVRVAADGEALTVVALVTADQEVPADQQQVDTLAYRGGTTFSNGDQLLTFEGGSGAADEGGSGVAEVLRFDVVSGYTVMRRR